MNKKICIIYGHCLAVSFVELLSQHKPFTDIYELVPYISTAITLPKEEYLKDCSLLIYQRASLSNPAIETINPNSTKISYPYSTFHSLWPMPGKPPEEEYGEWNYRIGGTIINLIQENPTLSPDEILSKYKNIDIFKYVDIDFFYKRDLDKFEYIDSFCDIKFFDSLESILNKQYFFTVNHLSIQHKISLLNKILQRIELPPLSNEITEKFTNIPQQMIPIHPQIINHFKLKWVDRDSKYWCFQRKTTKQTEANYSIDEIFGWFTFDEYIKNYITVIRGKHNDINR